MRREVNCAELELAFMAVGIVPQERAAEIVEPHFSLHSPMVVSVLLLARAAYSADGSSEQTGP